MRARKRSLGVGVLLASCCALVAGPALAGGDSRHGTDAQNHRAAIRDAGRLVARTPVPSGAVPSSTEPSGDGGALSQPAYTVGVQNLTDRMAWWTVGEKLDRVFSYVKAHPPSGGAVQTLCSGGGNNEPRQMCVGISFPSRPGVLGIRQLVVELVDLGHGSTGVRADGEVQWLINRPAGEKVPSGVRDIGVVRGVPGQPPAVSRQVTHPEQIRRIIRLIDELPVLQPGYWHCPAVRTGSEVDTFTFRTAPTGHPLARASVRADVGSGDTGCSAMTFSIRGRPQMALIQARHFLHEVGQILGARLTSRP
jgi:hypothetical protein